MTVKELFNALQEYVKDHPDAEVVYMEGMNGIMFSDECDIDGYTFVKGSIDGDSFEKFYLA